MTSPYCYHCHTTKLEKGKLPKHCFSSGCANYNPVQREKRNAFKGVVGS